MHNTGTDLTGIRCYTYLLHTWCYVRTLGVGNISLLSYIVILRAHDNRIVVVLKLSSYRVHIISGVVFAEIRHAVAK